MRRNATTPAKLKVRERNAQIMEYRKAGMTYQQIADRLGCSKQNVHKAIQIEMRDMNALIDADKKIVLHFELQRLDRMLLANWPKATTGDVQAGQFVLKIMERRSKYLGLDSPEKYAQTDVDGNDISQMSPDEIEARVNELMSKFSETIQ